jgi:hypothetical protein
VHPQADLLQVIRALGASSRLAGRLDSRQQEPNQNRDNGDDDQQFNECKAANKSRRKRHTHDKLLFWLIRKVGTENDMAGSDAGNGSNATPLEQENLKDCLSPSRDRWRFCKLPLP